MEYNLPKYFLEQIERQFGEHRAGELSVLLNTSSPTTVRINPSKVNSTADLPSLLIDPDVKLERRSKYGFALEKRPLFTLDPMFHAGCYYVQEASSMAIENQLPLYKSLAEESIDGKFRVLDLCAAPGGKSTHLLSMFGDIPGCVVVANEVIKSRAAILAENIAKWGRGNVVVTNNDPADFVKFESYFDLIVVDAPCSGEGMFRKEPASRDEWSVANVEQCAARQKRIVADIWPALREGGLMIYSTCTFNDLENGSNLKWIASELGGEILYSEQCFPGEQYGEGFFFGVLKKNGNSPHVTVKEQIRSSAVKPFKERLEFVKEGFVLYRKGDLVKGYPSACVDDMIYIEGHLRSLSSGVAVATILEGAKGKSIIPEADLALSEAICRGVFPEVETEMDDALKFLRKESLAFPTSPKGYLLVCYKGVPLGFVKNLGNRSNNLWPPHWRIRNV